MTISMFLWVAIVENPELLQNSDVSKVGVEHLTFIGCDEPRSASALFGTVRFIAAAVTSTPPPGSSGRQKAAGKKGDYSLDQLSPYTEKDDF